MATKFQFYLQLEGKDKDSFVAVRRVRLFDSESWFLIPDEFVKISHHEELAKLPAIKSAIAVLKSRGQYRNVNVSLPDAVRDMYCDEDGNLIFKSLLLGEAAVRSPSQVPAISHESPSKFDELVSALSQPRPESIKDILKHFLVEKFSPKNKNVEAWCELFEKESARFGLSGQKQIEVLKSCLDPGMCDWFSVNQRRLSSDSDWSVWKKQLLSTFSDHSWRPIRYAYNFKFLNGSLIDYAVKKEKILLELDREIPDLIILDLIVVGLPQNIQNSLNRHSVDTIEKLHYKLKKFDGEEKVLEASSKPKNFNKTSNFNNFSRNVNFNPSKFSEPKSWRNAGNATSGDKKGSGSTFRKPCGNCAARGFPDRYHLESTCWYKDKVSQNSKLVNNLEAESPATTSDEEQKN